MRKAAHSPASLHSTSPPSFVPSPPPTHSPPTPHSLFPFPLITHTASLGKVILIGYNTGMASGDAALKRSWSKELKAILGKNLLTVFTCANDHSDLKCELAGTQGMTGERWLGR